MGKINTTKEQYLLQGERASMFVQQFNASKQDAYNVGDDKLAEIIGQIEEAYKQFAIICYERGGKNVV